MTAKPEQNGKDDNVVLLIEIMGNKTAEQTGVKDTYSKRGSSKVGVHGGSQGREPELLTCDHTQGTASSSHSDHI